MTFVGRYKRELSVASAYGLMLLVLAILRPDFFAGRFAVSWVSAAPVLVAAIGMTLIILARHIDISIGAQVSICAMTAALAAKAGCPMILAVALAVLAGALMGALNGVLVAWLKYPSIVATLATSVILQYGLKWARQGQAVYGLPDSFQWFGADQTSGRLLLIALAAVILGLFAFGMRYIAAGRAVYAVGADENAARLAGLRPAHIVFWVFVLMGALSGVAAVLSSVRFAQVDPGVGLGLELQVIAAVVVGGTAISGGRGTLFGTLAGVALLGTIGAALGFLTDQAYWDRAVQGAIILAAVASDGFARGRGAA